jgi:phospholipid/cholesterol/gamma-HCH transport system permease protein
VVTKRCLPGRAGTSLTAEIGLMKAGEQISVMEMMVVDPIQRILAPRLGRDCHASCWPPCSAPWAIGGWVVGAVDARYRAGSSWSQQGSVDVWHGNGIVKSIVFGLP